VVVAIALRPPAPPIRPGELPEVVRFKGDPELWVYRKVGDASDPLRHGDSARRGDLLQLKYGPSNAGYGVIVSIDGRGNATLHFPANASGSTALTRAGAALPHAYELDDAPSFERFFIVTSAAPIDVRSVLEAARALGNGSALAERANLPLPDSLHQKSILLRKVAP
jgi:hypothetical protein